MFVWEMHCANLADETTISKHLVSAYCVQGIHIKLRTQNDFLIYLLIMLLQLFHPPPLHSIVHTPSLPHPPPPHSSCPWVIHISSLASTFPILFLTSPVYFLPTIYATYFLYLSPLSPPPTPQLITLHVIFISVVLSLF